MKIFTIIVGNFAQAPGVWYWIKQEGENYDIQAAIESAAEKACGEGAPDAIVDQAITDGCDLVAVIEGPPPTILFE